MTTSHSQLKKKTLVLCIFNSDYAYIFENQKMSVTCELLNKHFPVDSIV